MIRSRQTAASRYLRGFTLIELLVVVLILAILMAVALPLYLSAVADSQKKTCRANLQTIANAVEASRVKSGATDYSALIAGGVSTTNIPDLYVVPLCPTGGVYSLLDGTGGPKSFKVSCTLHATYEPGVDSN
jgi:type IV pilus assembly protein PilA